ncbi:MAG TPA: hypothetical protein VK789_34720 [Bryobacteraceae bacterium]|nr:hypothetical protein [Bryobacteraceae bacterium]
MPDFSIKDSLGNPIGISSVNWTSASSILSYAKTESLHLIVVPDFIQIKDKPLSQAVADPTTFKVSVQHDFQLGGTTPEVDITPKANATLTINTQSGSNLFDNDSFHVPADVPASTGYVGLSVTGSLDINVSGSSGDLCFGIEQNGSITFEYLKAFSTGADQPTLLAATSAMLSSFVIPASADDCALLKPNDVCSVSGQGSLKVSGGVSVSLPVNPLASVSLPLNVGTLTVQAGVMAGVTASFTLSGSYQIRVQKMPGGAIQLSYLKEAGTDFEIGMGPSAGVSVDLGTTDLLAKLLGVIEKGGVDPKVLATLTSDDVSDFNAAVKSGIDHSLQASVNLALSAQTDKQAAFQYEVRPDLLNDSSRQAVDRALRGDLTLLTALEEHAAPDGTIAPGVKLLNSVFSNSRTRGVTLKINLLGIVNLISMSQLISKCEFLFDAASGDLTIKETAQSEKISAITDPVKKQDALQKALFYSALATTTYVVGKAVVMPSLSCQAVYFTANQNTNKQNLADYANWFVTLNLMTPDERTGILSGFGGGGPSNCTVRTSLDNALCEALFLNSDGSPRVRAEYVDIGRQALKALLDPGSNDMNRIRRQLLDDAAKWQQAMSIGPSPGLGALIPLSSTNPQFNVALADVTGDVYDIAWWADAMQKAAQAVQQMRKFLAGRNPATLAADPTFTDLRNGLQKLMLGVVSSSKLRFHEPWGLVCLFLAAGSRGASGHLVARGVIIDKGALAGASVGGA